MPLTKSTCRSGIMVDVSKGVISPLFCAASFEVRAAPLTCASLRPALQHSHIPDVAIVIFTRTGVRQIFCSSAAKILSLDAVFEAASLSKPVFRFGCSDPCPRRKVGPRPPRWLHTSLIRTSIRRIHSGLALLTSSPTLASQRSPLGWCLATPRVCRTGLTKALCGYRMTRARNGAIPVKGMCIFKRLLKRSHVNPQMPSSRGRF